LYADSVIRTTTQHVDGAEDLFPQEQSRHQMGQCHGAQGEPVIGSFEKIPVEPEIAPDREHHSRDTTVRQLLEFFREFFAGAGSAMLVEGYKAPAGFDTTHHRAGFETQRTFRILVSATTRGTDRTILCRPSAVDPLTVGFDLALVRARRLAAEPGHPKLHCASLS
jgi:hypothetical protein